MAAIVTSKETTSTPVKMATETLDVDFNDASTAAITPSDIKAIEQVIATPSNATGASNPAYVTSFTIGDSTVTLTSANSATFIVTLLGKIA